MAILDCQQMQNETDHSEYAYLHLNIKFPRTSKCFDSLDQVTDNISWI